ncbi:MAG: sigma factor [Myxococcota bacterium]
MPNGDSLETSMAKLADGDRRAFDDVYAALAPRVRRFCERYLGGSEGDDATHDVLLKLFAQATSYRRGASVIAWALTLARWECRTRLRRRQRAGEEPLSGHVEAAVTEDRMETTLMAQAAFLALNDLGPSDRATILDALHDATPLGAIHRKRKQRAFERLRAAWRQRHGT